MTPCTESRILLHDRFVDEKPRVLLKLKFPVDKNGHIHSCEETVAEQLENPGPVATSIGGKIRDIHYQQAPGSKASRLVGIQESFRRASPGDQNATEPTQVLVALHPFVLAAPPRVCKKDAFRVEDGRVHHDVATLRYPFREHFCFLEPFHKHISDAVSGYKRSWL